MALTDRQVSGTTPWPAALEQAQSVGRALSRSGIKRVALAAADGHVLAADAKALVALPPFASSAMDGWAVAGAGPWRVVGKVLAGQSRGEPLSAGEAVAIATGAAVPSGTAAILRREHGVASAGRLQVSAPDAAGPAPGTDVRPAGQEAAADDVLLPAGTRLNPAAIGLLAAAGHDELAVRPHPRVAVLVLGDELLESGRPAGGRIRDALGPQLPLWLSRAGCEVISLTRVADTAGALRAALAAAIAAAVDLIVTTGSTAAGPADHLHGQLRAAGAEVVVDGVAVRPGHPMLLALHPGADGLPGGAIPLVGLPGNPLGALAGLATLVLPLLAGLVGEQPSERRFLIAGQALPGRGAHTLLPGRPAAADGSFVAAGWGSPHMLRGAAAATGFGVVLAHGVRQGEPLRWL
ncbi:MAG: hypothetical protein RLZ55_1139, partial [Actinomycetota bacterium]